MIRSISQHITCWLFVLSLFISSRQVIGQQILVDRGVRANGLWCFPLISDSLTYLYLPSEARLSVKSERTDSLPEFSYLRYIVNKPKAGTSTGNTVTDAEGGGILHFLVLYDTPEKQVLAAESRLKEILEKDEIKLRGPVVFEKGSYGLVSSIIRGPKDTTRTLLSMGEAPIVEGSKIALSFELDPLRSKLLLESFRMATPDISLVFDLTFSGLSDNYDATLEVNWEEVRKSEAVSAGGSIYFVSADVDVAFDKLFRDNAIKLTVNGNDDVMDGLLNTVYNKLLELLFQPVPADRVPPEQRGGLSDAISSMFGPRGMLSSRNTTGFGLYAGYQLKEYQTTGKSYLTFKGRASSVRHHYITFNIGDLYDRFGENPLIFKDVPLWDPAFQQREVFIGVDGSLEKEFVKLLNSVTVTLKKTHQSGKETLQQKLIDKNLFVNYKGPLSMVYGSDKDIDRTAWLEYYYQAEWQFQGGAGYKTDWLKETASMINLYTPFQRRTIAFEGDIETLFSQGVRAISVLVSYSFFGQIKQTRVSIRPGDNLSDKSFEITLPNNQEEIDYTISWVKREETLTTSGKDKYGLIFVDELPAKK